MFRKKLKPINLGEIYKIQEWKDKDHDWLGMVWKIRNPKVRHYRYKAILKDIFSKERMKRFGMIGDDKCEVCGIIETVQHQLFDCANAKKVRELTKQVTGKDINTMYDLIACTRDQDLEISKAIVIKCLIQIDRSRNITLEKVQATLKYFRITS